MENLTDNDWLLINNMNKIISASDLLHGDGSAYFTHSPANVLLPWSAVGITRETGSLRLQIRYGLQDQLVAFDLADIFKKTGGRALSSAEQEFAEVCDLVMQLYRPRIYRLERAGAQEYAAAGDEASKILDLRHNLVYEPFKDMRLGSLEIQYGLDGRIQHINWIDAILRI